MHIWVSAVYYKTDPSLLVHYASSQSMLFALDQTYGTYGTDPSAKSTDMQHDTY